MINDRKYVNRNLGPIPENIAPEPPSDLHYGCATRYSTISEITKLLLLISILPFTTNYLLQKSCPIQLKYFIRQCKKCEEIKVM